MSKDFCLWQFAAAVDEYRHQPPEIAFPEILKWANRVVLAKGRSMETGPVCGFSMIAYRMMELDRTKRWESPTEYDMETLTRLVELANALPEHVTLGDHQSEQVHQLLLYMDKAINGRGWGLDWRNPQARPVEPREHDEPCG